MTILWYPQHVNRDTLLPSNRIVIPTEVEGPAVSLPREYLIPRFIQPWVGFAGEELRNKPERVHTGERIRFPPTVVAGWEF
jgi:hypothetical protein